MRLLSGPRRKNGRPFAAPLEILAALAGAAFVLAACGAPTPTAPRLPHIVLIVPDDLGRHDVSFHGGEIATPNIDRIAAEGVLIERFYTAPICSPTRAGVMTGRYPIRYGLMRDVVAPWQDFGLDTEEVILPEVLARAGYEHRAAFGKWHLGHIRREHHPLRRGFTEFVGHNTSIDYFTKERFGERDWFHGYEPADEEGYVTDLVAEHDPDGSRRPGRPRRQAARRPERPRRPRRRGSGRTGARSVLLRRPEEPGARAGVGDLGAWKLVVIGPPLDRPGSAETSELLLYRIEEDPFEEHDLAADRPDVAARLLEKAREFRALQPPNPVGSFGAGGEGFQPPPNWLFPDA